jgi:hypothetical protein
MADEIVALDESEHDKKIDSNKRLSVADGKHQTAVILMKYWGRNPTWQRLAPSVTQPVRSN